ncbi:MAG: hypothetical protein E7166_04705 [Firmicutes bacterium]|nr:hypothetical protein [Bacillota bacterium]
MKIVIDNKIINIKKCTSFKDRLLGFMFKKNITSGLLFEKCNSIHTIFMKEAIDIIGINEDNKVVGYKKSIEPYKFLKIKNAKKIIELPSNSIKSEILNTKINFID